MSREINPLLPGKTCYRIGNTADGELPKALID
jgi:hypothetical protein